MVAFVFLIPTYDANDLLSDFVLFQASMTGSALSLYLEETKNNEDSVFQSEISPIKREGIHGESKNKSNLNMSSGARDVPSRGKGDPSDILSPTALALHKVALFGNDFRNVEKLESESFSKQTTKIHMLPKTTLLFPRIFI